jgi:hypothetical protein
MIEKPKRVNVINRILAGQKFLSKGKKLPDVKYKPGKLLSSKKGKY